jgi:hypothetical protein
MRRFCCNVSLVILGWLVCWAGFAAERMPGYPCEFYGQEETTGTLADGSVVTARTLGGTALGSVTVKTAGRYGFLTTVGAVDGDVVEFDIDGVKQQTRGVWKSGATVRADLGRPSSGNAFELHLSDMPGYGAYNSDSGYSGPAVADMILDFLDPANIDTQRMLMDTGDADGNGWFGSDEMSTLLNLKAPDVYNFSVTSEVGKRIDAGDQDWWLQQIANWLTFDLPNTQAGKNHVPVAVATSGDPAAGADSDYKHWMSVVGVRASEDPSPAGDTDVWGKSDTLQLYGVYVNDPNVRGLGFHSYISADTWKARYFRPMAPGLEYAGTYVAVMEPPVDVKPVSVVSVPYDQGLSYTLQTAQAEVSLFIPGRVNTETRSYLDSLLRKLEFSADFAALLDDEYFSRALNDTVVRRCYKVDGGRETDYTIIPFEREQGATLVTTAAVLIDTETGQFRIAAGDPDARRLYEPVSWFEAYKAVRKATGWDNVFPVGYRLAGVSGNPLFPGWLSRFAVVEYAGDVRVVRFNRYAFSGQGELLPEMSAPRVSVVDDVAYRADGVQVRSIVFSVDTQAPVSVELDSFSGDMPAELRQRTDGVWVLWLVGDDCRARVSVRYEGDEETAALVTVGGDR